MLELVAGDLDRAVVLCGADHDPAPEVTWSRGVTLLAHRDGPDPLDGLGPVGVAGWSAGGLAACGLAARHPEQVDRLVLLAVPIPEDPPFSLADVVAKVLLLYGIDDPDTGNRHGSWWQKNLPNARLEMQPGLGHDLLAPTWGRAMSHLAPRCRRSSGG